MLKFKKTLPAFKKQSHPNILNFSLTLKIDGVKIVLCVENLLVRLRNDICEIRNDICEIRNDICEISEKNS